MKFKINLFHKSYLGVKNYESPVIVSDKDELVMDESLCVYLKDKNIGFLNIKNIEFTEFSNNLIVYETSDVDIKRKKIMEIYTNNTKEKSIILDILKKHNIIINQKFPLNIDFHNKISSSPLSQVNIIKADLSGFARLLILFMIYNYFRLIINNFAQYNFVFIQKLEIFTFNINTHFIFNIFFILFYPFFTYYLQKYSFNNNGKLGLYNWIFGVHTFVLVTAEPVILEYCNTPFYLRVIILSLIIVYVFKMISMVHVLNNVHYYIKNNNPQNINTINKLLIDEHKDNFSKFLTIKKLLYFLIIPTLCFQLAYKKTTHIRKLWLLKKIITYILLNIVILFFLLQFLIPNLDNLLKKISNNSGNNILKIINVFLRLSTPNLVIWVLNFYNFFDIYLSIIAELTYFGDKTFYHEWWNCKNLAEYWRTWNLPVHYWFIRHLSHPLKNIKINRNVTGFLIFFVSALFHEYIISGALYKFHYWAFAAMLVQFFMIIFELYFLKIFKLEDSYFGNYSFWIMFCCIGQPAILCLYYINYYS